MPHCAGSCDMLYLAVNIYKHFSIWPGNVKLFTLLPAIISSEMWQKKWAHVTHRIWEASSENHCSLASILRHYLPVILMPSHYFCLAKYFRMVFIVIPWHPPDFGTLLFPLLVGVFWLPRFLLSQGMAYVCSLIFTKMPLNGPFHRNKNVRNAKWNG